MKQITRTFQMADGELSYVVQMATITTSLQPHLRALLKRTWRWPAISYSNVAAANQPRDTCTTEHKLPVITSQWTYKFNKLIFINSSSALRNHRISKRLNIQPILHISRFFRFFYFIICSSLTCIVRTQITMFLNITCIEKIREERKKKCAHVHMTLW